MPLYCGGTVLPLVHLARGEYQEALADYRRAYVEQFWFSYMYLAVTLSLVGQLDEAKMQLPKLREKLAGANIRKIDAFLKLLCFQPTYRESLTSALRRVGLEE